MAELPSDDVLLNDAIDYLDYIGWGDSWERECWNDTRQKLLAWQTARDARALLT